MHRYSTISGVSAVVWFALVASIGWVGVAAAQGKPAKGKAAGDSNFKSAAKQWEVLAFDAVQPGDIQGLGPYLWAFRATCDQLDNDLARRQCLGLRAVRQQQVSEKKFLLLGDKRSFLAGRFDPQQKGSILKIYSCFSCTGPIDAVGQPLYVVGQGEKTVFGTQILGPVIYITNNPFSNADEAATWKAEVAPRLRTEFIVRIPAQEPLWSSGGVQGLAVEILGFRIYDPCTGKMLLAEPKAKSVPRDESACTGEALLALQRARDEANAPKSSDTGPKLPAKLTPSEVQSALEPATLAAQECHAVYGVAGEARFRITIAGNGTVTQVEQSGYFTDTPTGACMEAAIRATVFPQTQKDSTTVTYPFVLR
jgi:hypothetical protein